MQQYSITIGWKNRQIIDGTWNVRTLYQSGKLENVNREVEQDGIHILGISEDRWKGSGKFCDGNHSPVP